MNEVTMTILILRVLIRALGMLLWDRRRWTSLDRTGRKESTMSVTPCLPENIQSCEEKPAHSTLCLTHHQQVSAPLLKQKKKLVDVLVWSTDAKSSQWWTSHQSQLKVDCTTAQELLLKTLQVSVSVLRYDEYDPFWKDCQEKASTHWEQHGSTA